MHMLILTDLHADGKDAMMIQRMLTDVIPQQGGVPIKFGDETIGGVGLSGAPNGGQQEEDCAKAGIAKVADQLKP